MWHTVKPVTRFIFKRFIFCYIISIAIKDKPYHISDIHANIICRWNESILNVYIHTILSFPSIAVVSSSFPHSRCPLQKLVSCTYSIHRCYPQKWCHIMKPCLTICMYVCRCECIIQVGNLLIAHWFEDEVHFRSFWFVISIFIKIRGFFFILKN